MSTPICVEIIVPASIQLEVSLPAPAAQLIEINRGLPGQRGSQGASAYEVALANGFVGDEAAWLASLEGEDGADSTVPGPQGPSAYDVAVANGFVGDEAAWLASLEGEDGNDSTVPGPQGPSAYDVAVANGFVGDEAAWLASLEGEDGNDSTVPGPQGPSAYDVAVANGFVGDEAAWLASLEGEDGADSTVPGPQGPSAYDVAVANGFVGDEAAWLASLEGEDGADSTVPGPQGPSAYDVAVANGFVGNEAAWLASLQGEDGVGGSAGGMHKIITTPFSTTFTTLVDVTGLSILLEANKSYRFDFFAKYEVNTSPEGFTLGIGTPSSPSHFVAQGRIAIGSLNATTNETFGVAVTAGEVVRVIAASATGQGCSMAGGIVTTDAGNLTIQLATETGGANSVTLLSGMFTVTEVISPL